MKKAQFRDPKGKWQAINVLSPTADPVKAAYDHCVRFGLATRVVELDGDKESVLREFRCQKKSSR